MPGTSRSTWARRIGSAALALALATPSTAFAAFAPTDAEIEELYTKGQDQAEARNFTDAADSWTQLLNRLDESPSTQAIRESVLINVLEAHINAYNLLIDESGKKDIGHLRKGKATLDQYLADLQRVHGESKAVSPAVNEKKDELEAVLKKAENDAKAAAAAAQGPTEPAEGDPRPATSENTGQRDQPALPPQNNGNGLIIGGAVVSALGIGALVMVPLGSSLGKQAEEDFEDADARLQVDPDDAQAIVDKEEAEFDGKQANSILIAGAVLFPLLLAGGVTMIVFGVKAKRAYNAELRKARSRVPRFSPNVGRNYAGFSLSGKF